ncbi:Cryptococcal mannosyltransferase 1 [Plasmodiophora brassicae]
MNVGRRGDAVGCRQVVVGVLVVLVVLLVATRRARPPPPTAADLRPLAGRRILIAANYWNNMAILPAHADAMVALIALLRAASASVFVSIYENGSTDGTDRFLRSFKARLRALDVLHRVVVDRRPPWEAQFRQQNATTDMMAFRIQFMADVRNQALEPLDRHRFDTVLFFNDVLFDPVDAVRLLLTDAMQYDVACAMDFNRITLYDTWVARDVNGASMSSFFPYVADRDSADLVRRGLPFPVASCWNGVAAIRASALGRTRFRAWRPGERRGPPTALPDGGPVYDEACPVSECTLLFMDLQVKGHDRFLINPGVHVTYSRLDRALHGAIGDAFAAACDLLLAVDRHDRVPAGARVMQCGLARPAHLRWWAHLLWLAPCALVVARRLQRDRRRRRPKVDVKSHV